MGGDSRISHRRKHLVVIANFELLRITIESELLYLLTDALVPCFKIFNAVHPAHFSLSLCPCLFRLDPILRQKGLEAGKYVFFSLDPDR